MNPFDSSILNEISGVKNRAIDKKKNNSSNDTKSKVNKALGEASVKPSKASDTSKAITDKSVSDQPITAQTKSSTASSGSDSASNSSSVSSSKQSTNTGASKSASSSNSSKSSSQSSSKSKKTKSTPDEKAVKQASKQPVDQGDVDDHDPKQCRGISDKPAIAINQSGSAINSFINRLTKLYLYNNPISKRDFKALMKDFHHAFFTQYTALSELEAQTRHDLNVNDEHIQSMKKQISHLKEIHAQGVGHELVSQMATYVQKMHDIYTDPRFQKMLQDSPKGLSKLTPSQKILNNEKTLNAQNKKYDDKEKAKAKNNKNK